MTNPTGAAASTPHVREISAPANTESTVALDPCSSASPCLVCWLRKRVAKDPETKYEGFRTGELELNIVGIRRRDSVTDQFDDFMVVFFKPLTPERWSTFERIVEQDLRDNWKKIFAKSSNFTKLVPCTKEGAPWIVSIYPLSTDPGLTDLPDEKAAKAKKASERDVENKQAAADEANKKLQEAEKELEAKQEAYKRLPEDPRPDPAVKPKKGAPKPPKAQAKADLDAAKAKVNAAKKLTKDADLKLKNAKDIDAKNAATLATAQENAKSRPPIAVLGDGTDGGLDVGVGRMSCRAYPDHFRLYIHNAGSATKFPKAHVALTITKSIPDGERFYSVSLLKSANWVSANKKDTIKHVQLQAGNTTESRPVVRALFVGGRNPGEKFAEDTATLVTTQTKAQQMTKTRDVGLEINGVKRALGDDDVLLFRATVSGTNLHRAHIVTVVPNGDELALTTKASSVKKFSEGCQVNPNFDAFNQFIRLAAIGKRWTCAKAKAETPGCARLEAADGDALSKGEQALLNSFGEHYINQATLTALTDGRLGNDNAQAITELESYNQNEAAKTKIKKAIEKSNDTITAKDQAIAKQKANNSKKKKKPQSDEEMALLLAPLEKQKAAAIAERDTAQKQLDELEQKETLKKDALAARRKFLNERTRFFRADFLRECDLHFGGTGVRCKQLFTYVLIEFDDTACNELERRFKEGRNHPWDGELVLSPTPLLPKSPSPAPEIPRSPLPTGQ